jgi:hypothetical protein
MFNLRTISISAVVAAGFAALAIAPLASAKGGDDARTQRLLLAPPRDLGHTWNHRCDGDPLLRRALYGSRRHLTRAPLPALGGRSTRGDRPLPELVQRVQAARCSTGTRR